MCSHDFEQNKKKKVSISKQRQISIPKEFARRKANIDSTIQRLVQEAKNREPIGDDLDDYLDSLTDGRLLEDE